MADWVPGTVVSTHRWNTTHYSVTIDAQVDSFSAGQFLRFGLDIAEERVGRPYSCVNSPHEDFLEIFFNVVPDGPLSARLASLQSGDPIWVTNKGNGMLTVEQVPANVKDLWLLSTGTAIGPFLSILKTDEAWRRFDKIVLAYGVRYSEDLAYQPLIRELIDAHGERLVYIPFVTREDMSGAIRDRIPPALSDGRLEQRAATTLDPSRSHVMLCGNAAMITDAVEVLEARGMKKHRRVESGHFSTEKYH